MGEIDRKMVLEAVSDKIDTLRNISKEERNLLEIYQKAYKKAKKDSPEDIMEKLDGRKGIGVPLEDQWEFNFEKNFETRKDMRDWAHSVLKGEPITGIDGSQAPADKIISLPIALVRAVAFINKHDSNYEKLDEYRVLTPRDTFLESNEYSRLNNLEINYARFDLENEVALKSLKENPTLILIDNTFILSYLLTNRASDYFNLHLKSLINVLKQTEEKSMLAGIVDPSQSKEISNTLSKAYDIEKNEVNDSALLYNHLGLFDRTCVYRSEREVLSRYIADLAGVEINYRNKMGFFYLKTHSHRPTRVEFPLWIQERGLVEKLANLIRASCVIGEGYPYELSKAHEYVTISKADREKFYEIVQGVAEKEGIDYSISQKEINKRRPVR